MNPLEFIIQQVISKGLEHIPNPIFNADWDVDLKLVYLGFAPQGASESSSLWIITYIAYNSNGTFNKVRMSNIYNRMAWDDRATGTYT